MADRDTENDDREFLAYTAGFFDADGTVGVYFMRQESCLRGGTYQLRVVISQKYYLPIFMEWLDRWGGSLVPHGGDARDWWWTSRARDALRFLEAISPYARNKKDQVDLAIEFQKRMAFHGGSGLADVEFAWQKTVSETLKAMKKTAEPAPDDILLEIQRTVADLSGQLPLWPED